MRGYVGHVDIDALHPASACLGTPRFPLTRGLYIKHSSLLFILIRIIYLWLPLCCALRALLPVFTPYQSAY